jgi:hypothetical protein
MIETAIGQQRAYIVLWRTPSLDCTAALINMRTTAEALVNARIAAVKWRLSGESFGETNSV